MAKARLSILKTERQTFFSAWIEKFRWLLLLSFCWSMTLTGSNAEVNPSKIKITANQSYVLYVNGVEIGSDNDPQTVETYSVALQPGDSIAVEVDQGASNSGFACEIEHGGQTYVSNFLWQFSTAPSSEWQFSSYDHSDWPGVREYHNIRQTPLGPFAELNEKVKWIWVPSSIVSSKVYFWTLFDPTQNALIKMTADNEFSLYKNGILVGSGFDWQVVKFFRTELKAGDLLAVHAKSLTQNAGCIAEIQWLENNKAKQTIVTNSSWKRSKLSIPDWNQLGFDDSGWSPAKVIGSRGISPWKISGTLINISNSAKWIWNSTTNPSKEIWFRKVIPNGSICIAADDIFKLYHNGAFIGSFSNWKKPQIYGLNLQEGDVIAVKARNGIGFAGLLASLAFNGSQTLSNSTWKHTTQSFSTLTWTTTSFDDSAWLNVFSKGRNGTPRQMLFQIDPSSEWIWASETKDNQTVYFRFIVGSDNDSSGFTTLKVTGNTNIKFYFNGIQKRLIHGSEWQRTDRINLKLTQGDVLAFKGSQSGNLKAGLILTASGTHHFVSDSEWKVSPLSYPNWMNKDFDDSMWQNATSYGAYGARPWLNRVSGFNDLTAHWIWSDRNKPATGNIDRKVFFRKIVTGFSAKVINTADGSENLEQKLSFDTMTDNPVIGSPQALQMKFIGNDAHNQAIIIRTENPDGRAGLIGMTNSSYNVPLHWAVFDDPISDEDNSYNFTGDPNVEALVLDVQDPSVYLNGTLVSEINGVSGRLMGYETVDGIIVPRSTEDGEVWIYFSADYTNAAAQTYRTEHLVIDIITLP